MPVIDPLEKGWFLQEEKWELGDFITTTPGLRALSLKWGHPVAVYFDTPYVGDLFRDCPFIHRLAERPITEPFGDSKSPRTLLRSSPFESNYLTHAKVLLVTGTPQRLLPYVDRCEHDTGDFGGGRRIALFQGCLSDHLAKTKLIAPRVMSYAVHRILDYKATPVVLGTDIDRIRSWSFVVRRDCLDLLGKLNIREAVSTLGKCDGFISNSTGLYHVGAALGLPGLAMFTPTEPARYKVPSRKVIHGMGEATDLEYWTTEIDNFLKGLYK